MLKIVFLGVISWLLVVFSASSILTLLGVGNVAKSIIVAIISVLIALLIFGYRFHK